MIDNNPLILIADDLSKVIDYYERSLAQFSWISTVSATSLDELNEVFNVFSDEIDVIILDGCIPGDTVNTIGFIQRVREAGFTKPIIAASSLPAYRDRMVLAGCSHQAPKDAAPGLALELAAFV